MDPRIIGKKVQILQGLATETAIPIAGWEARTAEHLGPNEYRYDGDWAAVELPARFPAGKTVFLRAQALVPASTRLADSYFRFDFQDLEGLLSLDGTPYAGIDWPHGRASVPAKGRHALELEFMSVPSVFHQPEQASKSGVFGGASLVTISRDIEAFTCEVRFAFEASKAVADPRRKPLLEAAVEAALLAVDLTLPRAQLVAEVKAARRILGTHLAGIAPDPEGGSIFAVGHTHIDTAWLWPLRETMRKCGRTFSTACRLMERYSNFHFTCSQPQLYRYTKELYPALYRQIQKWVKAGRWETAGAMWVEADCNVTGGESLIRQMLYGINFFREEFGTRPRLCWLPDVFGYPSSLPEILAGCGVESFYTYKLHWQAHNPFPYHLFRWRGLDGTEIVAHVVNHVGAYNNYPSPESLVKGWNMYAQKAEYPEVIFPFGYGDGGGGVTEDMMDFLNLAEGRYPGLPAVRIGTAEQFFAGAQAARTKLPVWDGELYVETHRGTYTTQSAMKRANRQSEMLLRDAEILGTLAALTAGATSAFDAGTLRAAWDEVLVHQFHDILPGSSIGMVYREGLATHARVQGELVQVIGEKLAVLLGPTPPAAKAPSATVAAPAAVRVFNSLSWPRQDAVTVELPAPRGPVGVVAPDGTRRPAQVIAQSEGRATLLFHAGGVPALGFAEFAVLADTARVAEGAPLRVSARRLENRFFRLTLNAVGGIAELYDKLHARQVLAPDAIGNDLQLLQDGPEWEDAWNVHETNDKRHYPFAGRTTVKILERGPVRASLRVTRRHRESTIEQDIVMYADLGRIDFVTRVDWQERHTMLKVAFPLNLRATRATYEVQFGAYERPTHRNTSWDQQKFEVPAQRWADISESGYGVSLLNDSRYGYDAKENVLRLTLLRSTVYPDPDADRGRHEFTYSLLPHAGTWAEAETVRRAWELNAPALACAVEPGAERPPTRSFVSLEGAAAIVEALKPAEDGRGVILRIYEPHGARGEVTIRLDWPVRKVCECSLVEDDRADVALAANTFRVALAPFQIRAFRVMA